MYAEIVGQREGFKLGPYGGREFRVWPVDFCALAMKTHA